MPSESSTVFWGFFGRPDFPRKVDKISWLVKNRQASEVPVNVLWMTRSLFKLALQS